DRADDDAGDRGDHGRDHPRQREHARHVDAHRIGGGLVEALAGAFLGGEYKLLATFIVLVLVLMVRPYGLFGTHEIERL
ncbi:MAG: hypothetical protein ABWZ88_10170, partial [Variovorax sp.]